MGVVQALVYDAHDYEPLSKSADPHGHGTDCECRPACKVCGSAEGAFIHTEEALEKNSTLVVRQSSSDDATAADAAGAAG